MNHKKELLRSLWVGGSRLAVNRGLGFRVYGLRVRV